MQSIAEKVIKKCGGVGATADLAGTTENWVYRWRLDRDKGGTGGTVPRSAQVRLLEAAAEGKVEIAPEDFFQIVVSGEDAA